MKKQKGFTLIELMVVVAIVGILTAIAVPMYGDYTTRGKIAEAFSSLADMRVRMEQYYQDNRNYGAGATCGVTFSSTKYFDYACVTSASDSNQTYVITATGNSGASGFKYSIDESNSRKTVTVGAGWLGANSSCWVRNKDGSC